MLERGQITKQISNLYTVRIQDNLYGCRARGKFRNDKISPVVGDYVMVDTEKLTIDEILERKNLLDRPVISNVDKAFIVTSTKKPNLDLNLLDKLISIITFNNIEPVICFTKTDLLDNKELEDINNLKKYYEIIGIKTFFNTETNAIKEYIKGSLIVLAGQTGAGKSSLINHLDDSYNIKTAAISEALGRGKHTTRHVELYEINNSLIADTPGFSCIDLKDMSKEQLRDTFIEFSEYECKYRDCMHNKEIGCKIKEAVEDKRILRSRYNNYLLFMEAINK